MSDYILEDIYGYALSKHNFRLNFQFQREPLSLFLGFFLQKLFSGSYFILNEAISLFLPSNTFSINIPLLGAFVVIIPLLVLFLGRAIDGITGGNISIANAYLANLHQIQLGVRTLEKWQYLPTWVYSRSCTRWNFRRNYLWSNIACFAALILSLVTIVVIVLLLRESKPSPEEMLVPEQGTIRKAFFTGMQRMLFGYKR